MSQMKSGLASRITAYQILGSVLRWHLPLDEAINEQKSYAKLSPADRGFARLMVTETLRHLGQIDYVLKPLLKTPINKMKPPSVINVLRLGVVQLLCLENPSEHAAVDLSVEMVARDRKMRHTKGMVNAVLRRIVREKKTLPTDISMNIPRWLMRSWEEGYGVETAIKIARSSLSEPALDITVKNPDEIDKWAELLNAEILSTKSLRCHDVKGAISELAGFDEGAWWVQDTASTLAVNILAEGRDLKGMNIIDLCAAPGGKTMQLAALGANVTAVDKSASRLKRLEENLKRTGLEKNVKVIQADITKWQPKQPADYVLLDAPCSATGTIRRHPDLLHLKSANDIESLVEIQENALGNSIDMLASGGRLIYCTCSLQKAENEKHFTEPLPEGFSIDPITHENFTADENGFLRVLPQMNDGMDGFFIARFARN